jgi:hypothetical protein
MGSWLGTCGITQLPITEGQRVVLIPLVIKQQDFQARSSLTGSGTTSNNLIAQPFSLQVAGEYDGYGSVIADANDQGLDYLKQQLNYWVDKGRLLKDEDGKPRPVKVLEDTEDEDVLTMLCRGELRLSVPNSRKGWLLELKNTIESRPESERGGFSHYMAQLEDDPNKLPDNLEYALGCMLVPEELFLNMSAAVGTDKPYGYWEDKANDSIVKGSTRQEELQLRCVIDSPEKEKIAEVFRDLDQGIADGKLHPKMRFNMAMGLAMGLLDPAISVSREIFYGHFVCTKAITDAAFHDNMQARDLWVNFILFAGAMDATRKQWTVQAGAGSSSGLGDSHALYQVTNAYLTKQLAKYATA